MRHAKLDAPPKGGNPLCDESHVELSQPQRKLPDNAPTESLCGSSMVGRLFGGTAEGSLWVSSTHSRHTPPALGRLVSTSTQIRTCQTNGLADCLGGSAIQRALIVYHAACHSTLRDGANAFALTCPAGPDAPTPDPHISFWVRHSPLAGRATGATVKPPCPRNLLGVLVTVVAPCHGFSRQPIESN